MKDNIHCDQDLYKVDLPKLHRIKQLLLDLKERNITLDGTNWPFIGYGNPNPIYL